MSPSDGGCAANDAARGSSSDEFICVRCARERLTCCQISEVYVTPGDVRRIAGHTGRRDFHHLRKPDDPIYADQDDDPVWQRHVFRADGSRRILKRRGNGDCTFLGEAGCVLPLEVRPLVCRIYPFNYDASGLTETSESCPLHLLRPGEDIVAALDMKRSDAERWHRQLYRELREEDSSCESA